MKCPYCGCINVAEVTDSLYQEKLDGIYRYLRDAEFEKANEALRDLLKKYPKNGELYFIKVLIDSRIVYVDDGEKKIPTYTNINFEIDNKDNAKKAIDYTDNPEEKKFYKAQLELIEKDKEEIQKIISSKENKYNYDVFISFKKSVIGNPSKDTEDFKLADKIYKHLLKEHHNLKVFYAPESLKAGESWERQIFNALYRSKCMIVIGSDIDNLNSPWVKNEWNRYLEMLNANKKAPNSLIPVVIGGDFYSVLPSKLSAIQGLAADVSLLNELSKMLKEIFKSGEGKKLEAKKYEAFSGVKVSKERADDVDIDLEAILVLAETDKSLADQEIKNFDQNNPKVKEVKFIVANGNIYDVATYDKHSGDEKFFKALAGIISADNLEKISDTIIDYVDNDKYPAINKVSSILFILPYIENLDAKQKNSVLKAVVKHLKQVVSVTPTSKNCDENTISSFAKEFDIYLTINEISDDDKQEMLFNYCNYLNEVIATKIKNNEVIGVLDERIKDRLQYLKYESCSLKKSEYNPLSAKISDINWLNMCANKVNRRTYVYANLIVNYNKARRYIDANKAIDELIKDSDAPELVVILHYLKLIAILSDNIWKHDSNTIELQEAYQNGSLYIAKMLKNPTLLAEFKTKFEVIKEIVTNYEKNCDTFDLKDSSYTAIASSKAIKSIGEYNEALLKELQTYWKEFDDKRLEVFNDFKKYEYASAHFLSYQRNFDYIPQQKLAYELLIECNEEGDFKTADEIIKFLEEKGYDPALFYSYKKAANKQKSQHRAKKIGKGAAAVGHGTASALTAIGNFLVRFGGILIYVLATVMQIILFNNIDNLLYTSFAQMAGFIYTFIRHLIIRENDDGEYNFSNIVLNIFAYYGWFLVFYFASAMDPGGENKLFLIPVIGNSVLFVANFVVGFTNLESVDDIAYVCHHVNPFTSLGASAAALVPFFIYSFGKQPDFIFYVPGIYNAAEPNINIYFNLFIAVLLLAQIIFNTICMFIMMDHGDGIPLIYVFANIAVVALSIVLIVSFFNIAPEAEEASDAFFSFYMGSIIPAFLTAIGGGIATLVGFVMSFDI